MSTSKTVSSEEERPLWPAVFCGLKGKCPHCEKGKLFYAYLKTNAACPSCSEALHHHRADDAPAWLSIVIVGHIVAGLVFSANQAYDIPLWVSFTLWPALAVVLSLIILQPLKGGVVALQWSMRMHGFDKKQNSNLPEQIE